MCMISRTAATGISMKGDMVIGKVFRCGVFKNALRPGVFKDSSGTGGYYNGVFLSVQPEQKAGKGIKVIF